jgi:hypothetical protein
LGYTDLIYDRILSGEIHAEYYAAHKWINRYSIEHCVALTLASDQKHDRELDDANHTMFRLPRDQVESFLSDVPGLNSNLLFRYEYTDQQEKIQEYADRFKIVERSAEFPL